MKLALRVEPRDDVALGVDHCRNLGHLALDQLRRAVGDYIGGAVGQQPESAHCWKHQRRDDNTGQKAAPRELDDRDGCRRSSRRLLRHAYRLTTLKKPSGSRKMAVHAGRLPGPPDTSACFCVNFWV